MINNCNKKHFRLCYKLFWLFIALISYIIPPSLYAQSATFKEHQIKAVFLFNFSQFITWPNFSFKDDEDDFVICIMEHESTFTNIVKKVTAGERVKGRAIQVIRYNRNTKISGCQILFFTNKTQYDIDWNSVKRLPILTVGESEGFVKEYGIINFILNGNNIHFEINHMRAQENGLNISFKLLRLAKIIK